MTEEREQAAIKFQGLAHDVALILQWNYDEPGEEHSEAWASISRVTGEKVCFYRYKARIEISGQFPNGYAPYQSKHVIRMSETKDARAIAKAMQSRLLGDYLAAVADAIRRKQAADAQQAAAEELAKRLGAVIGAAPTDRDKTRLLYYGPTPQCIRLELEVSHGDGGVKIEVRHLTAEQAERVLRVIAGEA